MNEQKRRCEELFESRSQTKDEVKALIERMTGIKID